LNDISSDIGCANRGYVWDQYISSSSLWYWLYDA